MHMKVLRRKTALEIHRSEVFSYAYPVELINADSTSHRNKTTRQLPVGGKVQWPGVLVFEKFPEGTVIMISEHARIQILTLRVRWK